MMKENNHKFLKQIKNNAVALISIFIAISSLAYNTWRNEQTEANRNQRHAAFEILVKVNQLQQVVFYHFYDQDTTNQGNPRTGWAHVLTIQDFSTILSSTVTDSCQKLHNVWQQHWQTLDTEQQSVDTILAAIDQVRSDVLTLLSELD